MRLSERSSSSRLTNEERSLTSRRRLQERLSTLSDRHRGTAPTSLNPVFRNISDVIVTYSNAA